MVDPQYSLTKLFTRPGHPSFLDLPWEYHLDEWLRSERLTDRLVEVERGRSRHTVVFVHYDRIYAIKELPDELGKQEYETLKQIEALDVPSVSPIGYALLKSISDGTSSSIVITEYLRASLPYRSLFMRSDLFQYQGKLLDALAVLLVTLHLKGIYWGDCSLSNILFKRDANELQAYLVDAETSEVHDFISDSKRAYELTVMEQNVVGELLDLSAVRELPRGYDIYAIGTLIQDKYHNLWDEITSQEIIQKEERHKITEKISRINDLGFTVEEIEIIPTGSGDEIRVRPIVTDRNYHQNKFHNLTGFLTEENIARKIICEIYELRTWLTRKQKRKIPLSYAAFYWNNNVYTPIVEHLDLENDNETGLSVYAEIIDWKQKLGTEEDRFISIEEAVKLYRENILKKREKRLFSRGVSRFRRPSSQYIDKHPKERISVDWKKRVVYHIYPRSFYDSDGNGVGDIPGIIEKLDYIKWLGMNAIRLSSIFPSPMRDMGYDITYFKGVDPLFGTINDFDELVKIAHDKDIKIILDVVLNHTSIDHPWFEESRSSRDNPYRDWYVWREPAEDGGPPNNWLSISGESVWTFDETTDEYYLHSFLENEPDLNWENEELQEKMLNVIRFWLDHGVDGIVLIMLTWLAKDTRFRDDPINPNYDPKYDLPYSQNVPIYSYDRPHLVKYITKIDNIFHEYDDRVSIAALDLFSPMDSFLKNYEVAQFIDIPLNIRLLDLAWEAPVIRDLVDKYDDKMLPTLWPNYTLSTHDFPRVVSRIGVEQSKVAALLLLTLRGIPFVYYGDEILMENALIPSEFVQDPWEAITYGKGRDPQRTPMQWDDTEHGGFTKGDPWLPVNDSFQERNVLKMQQLPHSMIYIYKSILEIRNKTTALQIGAYSSIDVDNPHCFVYRRSRGDEVFIIALNFTSSPQEVILSDSDYATIFTTKMTDFPTIEGSILHLREDEGVILEIDAD